MRNEQLLMIPKNIRVSKLVTKLSDHTVNKKFDEMFITLLDFVELSFIHVMYNECYNYGVICVLMEVYFLL